MKGNLAQINQIPFTGLTPNPIAPGCPTCKQESSVVGTGFTPEGIDQVRLTSPPSTHLLFPDISAILVTGCRVCQNPVYYEFVTELHWRTAPVADLTAHTIARAHRRYNLPDADANVDTAWSLLVDSAYSQDLSVQDSCGVPHFPGHSSQFEPNKWQPTLTLCKTYSAWGHLLDAAEADAAKGSPVKLADNVPFKYDLVNLGRELLAQLSTPVSMNFSSALSAHKLDTEELKATGPLYSGLLRDVDALVATDPAFLIGPWVGMARAFASNYTDCVAHGFDDAVKGCAHFYEWNARYAAIDCCVAA
jgi:hypothetical protein